MNNYVVCGSDVNKQRSKDGCRKYFHNSQITRCWHCGFVFCEDCFRVHHAKVKVDVQTYMIKKGGEK